MRIKMALYLQKLEFPSPKDALCKVWLKLAQQFWRRRSKCEKLTDGQQKGQTNSQTQKTGNQKSSLSLLAQVSLKGANFYSRPIGFWGFFHNKRSTGLNSHLSIRDCIDFLSEGLIFAYQQPHHRIYNKRPMSHIVHLG